MDKKNLIVGKKYQRKRKSVIDGIQREAECCVICERITEIGVQNCVFRDRIGIADCSV